MEKGFILYRGPSQLDGAPIVCIATMASNNEKTGERGKKNMVQTWILREDIAPHHALQSGDDASVCGDCIHRPANQGSCYVTVFQAPLGVWKAYHRGSYSADFERFLHLVADRRVRFGAYGDPAAVPTAVWAEIAENCAGITGYTHQWMRPDFDRDLLQYTMASVDTVRDIDRLGGARYFRVKRPEDAALRGEVECLADSVGKKCADCLLCDGGQKGKSVYINVHGAKASRYNPDLIASAI